MDAIKTINSAYYANMAVFGGVLIIGASLGGIAIAKNIFWLGMTGPGIWLGCGIVTIINHTALVELRYYYKEKNAPHPLPQDTGPTPKYWGWTPNWGLTTAKIEQIKQQNALTELKGKDQGKIIKMNISLDSPGSFKRAEEDGYKL